MKKLVKNIIFNRSFIRRILGYAPIGSNSKIHPLAFIDKNSVIGSYTYVAKYTSITSAKIGNYCSIAPFVKIGLGEHKYSSFSTSVFFVKNSYKELTEKECIIENDVWIGTGAVILRGVKIHTGAVIGANAVVTKDVEAYDIVVGVPAKRIKNRFEESKKKSLLESQWWNLSPQKASALIKKIYPFYFNK